MYQNSNPTYPTCKIDAALEAQIGLALRAQLDNHEFSAVKIIA